MREGAAGTIPPEPALAEDKLEALVQQTCAAAAPWAEAMVVLDRLLGMSWKQTAAQLLERLTARLEQPGPALKAELVLRRLQLSPDADEPVVREAALREVLTLNPSHVLAMAGLAEILVATGRGAEAVRICRALLAHHRETLPPGVRARCYTYLAQARLAEEGQVPAALRRARADLEKALDAAPDHIPARRLLAQTCYDLGQAEEGLALLEGGARLAADPVGWLCEAAQDVLGRAGQVDHAEHLLQAARAHAEADQRPLRLLIELHRGAERWEAVVRDLAALAALFPGEEGRPERAAAYHTMGQLYEERLGDPASALACFLQALDLSPELLDSFERASSLLLAAQDWRGLEEHHRLMLQRMGTDGPKDVRAALWKNLGQIHRLHLQRPEDAVLAYESVLRLRPGDEEAMEALAELYDELPAVAPEKRVKLHRALLALQPDRLASLRELRQIRIAQGGLDEAWCLSARLVADGVATPAEEAFYHNLARAEPPLTGAIPEELWSAGLRHPDQALQLDLLLGRVAAILYPLFASDLRALDLRPKDAVAPDAPLPVVRVARRVSEALGLPSLPAIHRCPRPGCRLAPSMPPVLLVGEEQFAGRTLSELTAALTRELAQLRAGHLLPFVLDLPAQRWLVRSLLAFFGEGSPPDDTVQARRVREVLDGCLPADQRPALVTLARGVAASPAQLDGEAHRRGLAATAGRCALLLSEDLPAVQQAFAAAEAVLADLRSFAISQAYLSLRRELGLALAAEEGAESGE